MQAPVIESRHLEDPGLKIEDNVLLGCDAVLFGR
jgi:hypothetical protein